ncbi:MAG: ABC transporter permease [Symbiobacteriia bacterium]
MKGVLYREWVLFSAQRAGFWLGLAEPAFYLTFFLAGIGQMLGGGGYVLFAFPGLLAMMAMVVGQRAGVPVFFDRMTGEAETLCSLPLPRVAFLSGRLITAVARMWVETILAIGLGLLLYPPLRTLSPTAWLFLTLGAGGAAVLWSCIFIWIAGTVRNQTQFNLAMNLVISPLLLTSTAFYPLEHLPAWVRWVGAANPMSYVVTGLRAAVVLRMPGWLDVAVVAATGIIAFAGAWRSFGCLRP